MVTPFLHARSLASNRRSSEDRAEIFEREDGLVVVVADGVGGVSGGAVASEALLDAVRAVAENATLEIHDVKLWAQVLEEADGALAAKVAGETTGVVVVVGRTGLVGASAGDSEAWVVTASSIDDLTASRPEAGKARERSGGSGDVPAPRAPGSAGGRDRRAVQVRLPRRDCEGNS